MGAFAGKMVSSGAFSYKARRGWARLTRGGAATGQGGPSFYEAVWRETADRLGCAVTDLGGSLLEIQCGERRVMVCEKYTSLDDPVTIRVTENKPLVYSRLRLERIPVPAHTVCRFNDFGRAWAFVRSAGGPCVVKPAHSTDGGNGVSAWIEDRRRLAKAMALAGSFCSDVLLEKQLEGSSFRLLYLDGELLDAVRRMPPTVAGDGHSTVRELVEAENARRSRRENGSALEPIDLDSDSKGTLRRRGYYVGSVLPVGKVVELKTIVRGMREENERAVDLLCSEVIAAGSMATTVLGVRLAGVDIVTPDPAVPLEHCGGAIIEVNTPPGLFYHYVTRQGSAHVADAILERLIFDRP